MAAPTSADIASIAAQFNIPPAVLMGVVKQEGVSPTYSLPSATMGAYNLSPSTMRNDPLLALTVVAQTLATSFAQTGSWESALSQYLTGNPQAWQSPTSSVGGQVMGILGQASTDPTFGMSGYTPTDVTVFNSTSAGFEQHLQSLVDMGGVVSQQTVQRYGQMAGQIGTQQYQQSANMEQVAEDILGAAKITVTDANVALITTMARGEGMPLGSFNWLASTSNSEPSVGTINNTPGVKEYATYQDGVDATAQTLLNGNYDRMVQLMRSGADLSTIAQDPGVAQDLRTWQGGSSEDVNNLQRLRNVPGAQPKDDKEPVDPAKVGEFATQLKGANIDPDEFSEYFPTLAAQRRKLLGSRRTDVSDYASMQQALSTADPPAPVTNAGIIAHLRGQPHPVYSTTTVGDFHDAQNTAALWSVTHTGQMPTDAEVARLSGLDNKEIANYYMQKAEVAKQGDAAKPQPAQPAPTSNVVQMPGREQQRQQQSA